MLKKITLFIAIIFLTNSCAQQFEKVTFEDTQNSYLKLIPKNKPKGLLIVLHGGGENAEDVMNQIGLDELAVKKDFIVIFPNIEESDFKMETEQAFLDRISKEMTEKYKISKNEIIIGGLSGGGMLAITYTERAIRDKNTFFIPKAVFALDPPLDYENFYYRLQREIKRNFSEVAVNEAKWFLNEMEKGLGGTPETAKDNYIENSMFSYHQKDGGNAKYLLNIPIRIYTEPGIEWQLKNRQRDLYDLNCTDISALINFLQLNGNSKAELIITENKGIRPDGSKHPHSWSIMDSDDMMSWISGIIN